MFFFRDTDAILSRFLKSICSFFEITLSRIYTGFNVTFLQGSAIQRH